MRIQKSTITARFPARFSSIAATSAMLVAPMTAVAAGLPYISGTDNLQKYTDFPATGVESAQPQTMLTLSKDHSLFLKAYNDFTDLNGDGTPETTYKHSFRYYGYFDDGKCYTHNGDWFVPAGATGDDGYCNGQWSGNFLNWASMARIDVVRKILFGGKRHIDGSITLGNDRTVLERAYLPNDAHAWSKHYAGDDISKLTPFSPPTNDSNPQKNGLTICNTTYTTEDPGSELIKAPPLIRVAQGNFALWGGANERWQCLWDEEQGGVNNDNDPKLSGLFASSTPPKRSSDKLGEGDYVARVRVCVPGLDAGDRCKRYPDGTLKPIGLLQEYGDSERMWFGLVTGTYSKNKSGGDIMAPPAVRSANGPLESSFTQTVNIETDGRFIKTFGLQDEDGVDISANNAEGIINSLSLFRIVDYRHSDGVYADCTFRLASFKDGECKNWGSPLSEIYLAALSWFGGRNAAIGEFRANESSIIRGLNQPTSRDLTLNDANSCATLSTVVFNSSLISYDGDQIDATNYGPTIDLNSMVDSQTMTRYVGASEGIHGNEYFVGENGATVPGDSDHQVCIAKTVENLGDVRGLCPDAPRVEGTYRIAGLAYHARSNDINKDIQGEQTVKTFVVQLASSTPTVRIPVPGSADRSVTLLPACQNDDLNPDTADNRKLRGSCSIVDFRIAKPHTVSAGEGTGSLYVNWENGEQGGDYDQDMWGTIDYKITSTTLTVTTNVIGYSGGGARMGFGYILDGTTQDGVHYHSGAGGTNGEGGGTGRNAGPFFFKDPTGSPDCSQSRAGHSGQPGCRRDDPATSRSYTIGLSDAQQLQDPLWYAAKYGGYRGDHVYGSGAPLKRDQWDTENARGEPIPNGNPDNYFLAVEPRQLEESLRRVFDEIIGRVSSGTSAAVVANAREGEGAVYQALFEPFRSDANGNEVRWIGGLQALWVDREGRLREDNGDNRLGSFAEDPAVELFFDESSGDPAERRTRVRRYVGDPDDDNSVVVEIDDLNPLWNARDLLSALPNVGSHRAYSQPADTGRSIYTWLDLDLDGEVDGVRSAGDTSDGTEVMRFLPGNFGDGRYGILNTPDAKTAATLVDYIRGNDQPALRLRNRQLDHNGDGSLQTMRLGDIVNSTPTVVGTPAEAFDLIYDDRTYDEFRRKYRNRRNVVYVGANDGMLHAFNAGFYNATEARFLESLNGEAAHPLGAELWAYIPFHLLPHLTWLTDNEYTHAWYVDGKPRVFDARVFDADEDHPNGWGTILVVGMRFGGGDISLPTKQECEASLGVLGQVTCTLRSAIQNTFSAFGFTGASSAYLRNGTDDELRLRSSFIVMDITNPEKPPRLLGEISDPDMGFTSMTPSVIAHSATGNQPSGTVDDNWYLVLGNGPDNLESLPNNLREVRSSQSGKLWMLDLKTLVSDRKISYLPGFAPAELPNSMVTEGGGKNQRNIGSFVTASTTADWNLDFKADALYFGTSFRGAEDAKGALWKVNLRPDVGGPGSSNPADWNGPFRLLDTDKPVTAVPSLTIDNLGNWWVLSGTGRFFNDPDRPTIAQQSLFGVIDPAGRPPVDQDGNIATFAPGRVMADLVQVTGARVFDDGSVQGIEGVQNENDLVQSVRNAGGWRLDLAVPASAERMVSDTAVIGGIFFASAFTPSDSLCGAEGRSRLFGLRFDTGAPDSSVPTFGTTGDTLDPDQPEEAVRAVDIGVGLGSAPSIYLGGARDRRGLTIFTQTSTGAIQQTQGLVSDAIRSGELDWRERY